MRLSEKTIELNFCAQLNEVLKRRLIWFGLTQDQEFEAGFDAYTRLGGSLLILQFKTSNYVLTNGRRQFQAQHHQLEALRPLGRGRPNSVFYVFPGIGNTSELSKNSDLISQCQLLDAGTIPDSIGPPKTRKGALRKNGRHYVDVDNGFAIIHSDPVSVQLSRPGQVLEAPREPGFADEVVGRIASQLRGVRSWLRQVRSVIDRNALGAILLPPEL